LGLGPFVFDVVSAVSLGVVDERHLSDVDYVQLGVGPLGELGSGDLRQLGLLGTVGGHDYRGGKDDHRSARFFGLSRLGGMMPADEPRRPLGTLPYSPECVGKGLSKKFISIILRKANLARVARAYLCV
jgi:hypothetical protein